MKIKSISSVKNLKNKKALLRLGLDSVAVNGKLADKIRLNAVLPTINYLLKKGAAIIIITHLGRPNGDKFADATDKLSTKPLAKILSKALKKNIEYANGVIEPEIKGKIAGLKSGGILLLENVRFYEGEEKNDSAFAKKLAEGVDLFVNEAFSVCHRANASVSAITKYLPNYAGLSLEREIDNLSRVLAFEERPRVVLLGGAKIETKVAVIENLLKKADLILTGGMVANSFLAASGMPVGSSKTSAASVKIARKLLCERTIMPIDAVVSGKNFKSVKIKKISEIKSSESIFDIGPETVSIYSKILAQAKMIVFNGPMGYFEDSRFKNGSKNLLNVILANSGFKAIGGGETLQLLANKKMPANCFVSTGGGAMLEFLAGKVLPGIKPLIKR